MVQYTAAEKARYYAANPDKLALKMKRDKENKNKNTYNKKIISKKVVEPRSGVKVSKPYSRSVSLLEAQSYMSPFGKEYPPQNPNSLGHFTTLSSVSRQTISTSTTNSKVFVFMPGVRGVFQTGLWDVTTGLFTGGSAAYGPTARFLNADAPINMRPLRAGVRIRNVTSNQDVGGMVRVLQQSAPLEWEFVNPISQDITTNMTAELESACSSNPRSYEKTGQSFIDGENEIVISPCTMSSYNSYGNAPFDAAAGASAYQSQVGSLGTDMPMNLVIILFEPTSAVNTYSLTFCEQMALRYPSNTVLNELGKPHSKVTDSKFIDNVHEKLAEHGHIMYG